MRRINALVLLAACAGKGEPAAQAESSPPAAAATAASSVETRWVAVAAASDLAILEATAWTVPTPGAVGVVTTTVRGRIERLLVRPGDRVHAGDAMLALRPPELISALASRSSAQKRIAAYEKHVRELSALRKDGLLRTAELFQVEAQLADIQAEKSAADAILRGAGVDEHAAQELAQTGLLVLRAPMDGTVRAVAAELGGMAEPGAAPLVELTGARAARVEAHLHQPLPEGVRVRLESTLGGAIALQDAATASAIDPVDGSHVRWFEPATATELPSHLRGRLVVASLPDGAFQVPARALVQRPDGAAVVARTSGGAVFKPVQVLAVSGTSAIVRGLRLGETIAAEADRSPLARPPEGD